MIFVGYKVYGTENDNREMIIKNKIYKNKRSLIQGQF